MTAKRASETSYYEVLEVDPTASSRDVHQAYMRAKETYSPDSPALYTMFSPEEARELLKLIDEAFTTLSNQTKRQEYDLSLAKKGHPSFATLLKNESARGTGKSERPRPVQAVPNPAPAPAARSAAAIVGEEGAVLKPSRTTGGKDELPNGFARTKFGVYELNALLETEMTQIEECDGAFLQKIRQYKKIGLDQMSDATRIGKSHLAALEANAYESLPAAVFVRGFVVQYVRVLGAPDRIVDAYMKRFRKNNN